MSKQNLIITMDRLDSWGACPEAKDEFHAMFPAGRVVLTRKILLTYGKYFDITFLAIRLLDPNWMNKTPVPKKLWAYYYYYRAPFTGSTAGESARTVAAKILADLLFPKKKRK